MAQRVPKIKPFTEKLIRAFEHQMSADHTAILLHHDVQGFGYLTIAGDFGISFGTVKSRLHRDRQALNLARVRTVHPNGKPMFAEDGTLLNEDGTRSIFDDVDE